MKINKLQFHLRPHYKDLSPRCSRNKKIIGVLP